MSLRCVPLCALVAAALLSGCGGPSTYRVTGEVSWMGTLIEDGQINFIPEDSNVHPSSARIVSGRYEARVYPGVMKVEVHGQKDMGYSAAMHQNTKKHYVDPEYNGLTVLRFDVQKHDNNVADFRLPLPK